MDIKPGELLVVRLWRWAPDRIRTDALKEIRQQEAAGVAHPVPSISVFAMEWQPSEEVESLMVRLCEYVKGVPRDGKYAAFTTSTKLADAGFTLKINQPPEHHFDVVISDISNDAELEALSKVFDENEKRRFPTCLKVT